MKISCLSENLSQGLNIVSRTVATKTTLPILSNVLLQTNMGLLQLSASNLERYVTTSVGAIVEEEGAVAVPFRLLSDWVHTLPSDRIDMDLEGGILHIRCGKSRTNINVADAGDFVTEPALDTALSMSIDTPPFRTAVGMVLPCVAKDDSRPVLTGVLLSTDETNLTLATADGFRLAVHSDAMDNLPAEPVKALLPSQTLHELHRLTQSVREPLQVEISSSHALFKMDNLRLVSQLVQGSFPNYEQLIPANYETRVVVDVNELKRAVQASAVFAKDGSSVARVEIFADGDESEGRSDALDGNTMQISAISEESGNTQNVLQLSEMEGDSTRIAFNVKYLQELLGVIGQGNVALEVTTASAPGVFRLDGSTSYCQVVMPMYVQW